MHVETIEKKNATWVINSSIGKISTEKVVVTAGAWSTSLTKQVGEDLPLYAKAPMLSITNKINPLFKGILGTLGKTLSLKQFDNGSCLIGGGHLGTAYPGKNKTQLDYSKIVQNITLAKDVIPDLRKANLLRSWAGIEGYMPDNLPVISRSLTEENLFYAFGFSAHGFQLGPIVGKILSELIDEGNSHIDISAFNHSRFY